MKKSKKLILICLLGLIATACSSDPTRKDVESETSNAQKNFLQQQFKHGAINEK
jgi:PBP1b-binding outer membrane lipoprotein LpoB